MAAAAFLVAADARLAAPLLPAIEQTFHSSTGAAGFVVSGYLAAYALCQLAYGPFGDRIGPLTLIRGSLALFAVGTTLCALSPSLGGLVALRVLTGMSAAAVIPMGLAHLGNSVALEHRTRVIGGFMAVLLGGQALGAALGGLLAELLSWRAIFVLIGVCAAASALALRRAPPAPSPRSTERSGVLATLGLLRRDPVLFGSLAVEAFAVGGAFPFVGAALVAAYGLGYGATGALLALYAVGGVVGARLRVDGVAPRLRWGGALLAGGFAALALERGVALSAAGILGLGLGMTLAHATLQSAATEVAPTRRASALSLFSFVANAIGALGSVAVGMTFDAFGASAAFAGAATLLAGFAVLAPRLMTRGAARVDGRDN